MTAVPWFLFNCLQISFMVLWTLLWLSIALVSRWLTGGTRLPLAMARHAWAPPMLRLAGARLKVEGLHHLQMGQSYFLAVNHQSALDVLALYDGLPMPLLFVLKEELGRIPLLGSYVRAMGMVLIKRTARRQAMQELKAGGQRFADGYCLVAFPEGTRTDGDKIQPFKAGVFVPAIDAQIPIVPIALDGPARLMPKGTIRMRPGVIRMSIGKPIASTGYSRGERRELSSKVEDAVRAQWVELVGA